MKNKKVYCKNCKFKNNMRHIIKYDSALCIKLDEYKETFFEKNKNNNCIDYKHKWYKFWL